SPPHYQVGISHRPRVPGTQPVVLQHCSGRNQIESIRGIQSCLVVLEVFHSSFLIPAGVVTWVRKPFAPEPRTPPNLTNPGPRFWLPALALTMRLFPLSRFQLVLFVARFAVPAPRSGSVTVVSFPRTPV